MLILSPPLLVLYFAKEPLKRQVVKDSLRSWRDTYDGPVVYVNTAFRLPKGLEEYGFAATILDTSMFKPRWNLDVFAALTPIFQAIAALPSPRIAFPQDEFLASDPLSDALVLADITAVFSCAEVIDQAKIYSRLIEAKPSVQFETCLTAYVSDALLASAKRHATPWSERNVDVGQRVWDVPYWLGQAGRLKSKICHAALAFEDTPNWTVDISLSPEQTLTGSEWHRFLGQCKAVIGAEGGASILDRTGSVRACSEALKDATFEQTEEACFPERDGELGLSCLSPRHLEAAAMGCVQILVEGDYNGVFEAGTHYVPVKADFSNLKEAIASALEPEIAARLTQIARSDIVESGRYSYRNRTKNISTNWFTPPDKPIAPPAKIHRWRRLDEARRYYIRIEHFYARHKGWLSPFVGIIRPFQRLIGRPQT